MIRKISLLLCLLLLSSPVCMAYTISTDELNRLDQNLTQLEQNNNQLQTDLAKSKQDLQTASSELIQLKTQLTTLRDESTKAKAELTQAQNSLQIANGLLKQYATESNKEIESLKIQRIGLGVLLLYAIFRK